jgi:hypothetical protein
VPEENVIARRRRSSSLFGLQLEHVSCLVIPVSNHVRAKIDVVVGRCRAVDHDGARNSVAVLDREVTMIPARKLVMVLDRPCRVSILYKAHTTKYRTAVP